MSIASPHFSLTRWCPLLYMHVQNFVEKVSKRDCIIDKLVGTDKFRSCWSSQTYFFMHSPSVNGTGAMKWMSLLKYQTGASLWQWLERRCMLTTKSGIWQSEVWVYIHARRNNEFRQTDKLTYTSTCSHQVIHPSSKPLKLKHFFFTAWPDHGVPQHPYSLVKFIQHVRKVHQSSSTPQVVHCRYVRM